MTIESPEAITTTDVARYVVQLPDEAGVTARVDAMTKDEALRWYARAKPISATIAFINKAVKKKIAGEQLLAAGERWTDPDTKIAYDYRGEEQEWKVADPSGMRWAIAHLKRPHLCQFQMANPGGPCSLTICPCKCDGCEKSDAIVAPHELDLAMPLEPKPNHTQLNKLSKRDPRLLEVISDFREKPVSAPDLREVKK